MAATIAWSPEASAQTAPSKEPIRWSMMGQLAGTGEAGGDTAAFGYGNAAISVDVWRNGYGCRQFDVGGRIGALAGGIDGLEGRQWASACISADNEIATSVVLDVRHYLEWNARPSLLARRSFWARRYRRETIDAKLWRVRLKVPEAKDHELETMDARAHFEILNQADGDDQPTRVMWRGRGTMLRWVPQIEEFWLRSMEVFTFQTSGVSAPGEPAYFSLTPIRLSGMRMAQGLLFADFEPQFQKGSGRAADQSLIQLQEYAGELSVYRDHGPVRGGISYTRGIFPTFDGQLSVDDRGTLWLSSSIRGISVDLRGFIARTRIDFDRQGGEEGKIDITGGASIDIQSNPEKRVHFMVSAEAGRSFYADINGDRNPRASLGYQVRATLNFHLGDASERADDAGRLRTPISPTPGPLTN